MSKNKTIRGVMFLNKYKDFHDTQYINENSSNWNKIQREEKKEGLV